MILRDRAQRRGIKDMEVIIRKGIIPEQLSLLASEIKAEMMVLGRPVRRMGRSVFTPDEFDRFVEDLEKNTGIQIVQVIHNK